MASKKNIIKDLKQEIIELQQDIHERDRKIQTLVRSNKQTKAHSAKKITYMINFANALAFSMQKQFVKELTWLELCDDPSNKFQEIKKIIKSLRQMNYG
jgi:hypothetical protein